MRKLNLNYLLICCTHHKTGASLMVKVWSEIARAYNMKIQICEQNDLEKDCQIWVEWHSKVNLNDIQRAYRGIHIIRDPRDIVVSGYFYHKRGFEDWCLRPQPRFNGLSYKEFLNQLSQDDGLLFEMNDVAKDTIRNISIWEYDDPNIFEVKFEELMKNYDGIFREVYCFFDFHEKNVKECIKLSSLHNLKNYSEEEIKKMSHVHSTELQKWKKYFKDVHKKKFKGLFGDILVKLGYEKNNQW